MGKTAMKCVRTALAAILLVTGLSGTVWSAGITYDDFSGTALGPGWIIEDPGAVDAVSLTGDGWLSVDINAGQDIWINNRGGGVYLLTEPVDKESYALETFVDVGAGGSVAPASMGGLVLVDSDDPAQFPFELTWGYAHGDELLLQHPGTTHARIPLEGQAVFLRLERDGAAGTWTALYKIAEDDPWTQGHVVQDGDLPGGGSVELQVGLFIKTWGGSTDTTIAFDYYGFPTGIASDPRPEDEATDVPRDTSLSWLEGENAATHTVYFGAEFDDVNAATVDNPLGVLVSQGQAEAVYTPEAVLASGQTYYWRVDEVNAAPDNTIFRGDVWSFTVEPLAYPIDNVVATSNGADDADAGPENTVNGSGLTDAGEHSTTSSDMWLTTPGAEPLQVQYDFDRVYKLHEMLVWNYNAQFEAMLGFGLKDVTIEYSDNGIDWAVLGDVVFNQATATGAYTANTAVEFGGVAAQHVRITVNSGYGMLGKFGLSEVRFLYIPVQAREPEPEDGATDVTVNANLSWRAGREAVSSEVYLGTDPGALELIDATTATTVDPGALDAGATYYWKVTEVNEAETISTWEGAVWSFSTEAYIVVEGFESYDDDENRIYNTWIDGYGVPENGSQVGHLESPFAETTIVHGGGQSMPLFYDNTGAATSEAEFTLSQDWTANGVKSLSLYFHGAGGNGGQLYVKINNTKISYDGDAGDIAIPMWHAWNIDLSTVGGNLSSVTTLTIGVEGAGVAGVIYIDDIRLYPKTPEFITPTEPDTTGLLAYYALDGNANDGSGNGHDGAAAGDLSYETGVVGSAASFDGIDSLIDCGDVPVGQAGTISVAFWVNPRNTNQDWAGYVSKWTLDNAQRTFWVGQHGTDGWLRFGIYPGGPAAETALDSGQTVLTDGEWTHIVCTYDGSIQRIYAYGVEVVASPPRDAALVDRGGNLRLGIVSTANWFDGLMDEVRIYDQALSAEAAAWLAGKRTAVHRPF